MKKWLISICFILVLLAGAFIMAVNMRFPVRYMHIIEAHAGEIDPSVILAVIMAESSFRPNVQSPAGAQGLMQLMPTTAEWLAGLMGKQDFDPDSIWDPQVNIAMGSFYLNWLKRRYQGDINLALAAYNAGQGRVNSWLADPEISSDGRTLDIIPFPETRNYVERVEINRRVYAVILRVNRMLGRGGAVSYE
ncbi:MAG: lytic transglycosylase domain-containing protein [Defluviitaleaceae bacterium]|nr:lytic transglycosylase domain-containing protein [Defluviitaleaceae bacterium]